MLDWLLVITITVLLAVISWVDVHTMKIPNRLLILLSIPIAIVCFRGILWGNEVILAHRICGFFIASVPMYLLAYLKPGAFGGGDIKMVAVCGLLLGWKLILIAVLLAIFCGGLFSIYLIGTKKLQKDSAIPFGPFLSVGIFLAMVSRDSLWISYMQLLGIRP